MLSAVPASDDVVMARVAAGDRRAFGELYERYAPRVLGLAIRIVIDRAIAEEVAQEAFLEIWRKAPRFDGSRGALASWILTITRSTAIDRIRSEEASRRRQLDIGVRDLERDADVVEERIDEIETGREVRAALDELPPAQREAVELSAQGWTHREIAERLGVPIGTVKTRIRTAMIRLRTILAPAEQAGGAVAAA